MKRFQMSYGTYATIVVDENQNAFIEFPQWVNDHFETVLIPLAEQS